MGLFGMGNMAKAGPGVNKDMPQKKRFFLFWELFFRKFWKFVTLNLLYIVCCLPIVTIGPATAGFTYVLRNFSREEHSFLLSDFFEHGFKKNWKQSVIISIINAAAITVLSVCIVFYNRMISEDKNIFFLIAFGFCIAITFTFLCMNYYLHIMIVTVDLKVKYLLKNAFILTVLGIKTNLITTFFIGLTLLVVWLFGVFGYLFMMLIGFSFIGFIIVFNSYQYIQKYIIDVYNEKQNEDQQIEDQLSEDETIFEDMGDESDLKDKN